MIVAIDQKRGIGLNGQLPWHFSGDLKHFKEITVGTADLQKKNIVVMGRKTWESLPEKFRPLPNRINVVLTSDQNYVLPSDVYRCQSFKELEGLLESKVLKSQYEKVFIIGGEKVFKEALWLDSCRSLFITHIQKTFTCDTFFPAFEQQFKVVHQSSPMKEGEISYRFTEYKRNI